MHDGEVGGYMINLIFDHRSQVEDRRSWTTISEFPVKDCNGLVVYEDRRQHAERRGYQLEELAVENIGIRSFL